MIGPLVRRREEELTVRLTNLIEVLSESSGLPTDAADAADAARTWTEADIRRHFATGGAFVPPHEPDVPATSAGCDDAALVAPAAADSTPNTDTSQPGGACPAAAGLRLGAAPPRAVADGQLTSCAEEYRDSALRHGIPFRPAGLFAPGDAVIREILGDGFRPFQKHMVGLSGRQEPVAECWPTGNGATAHGLDLRCFHRSAAAQRGGGGADDGGAAHGRLAAAVRWGDAASIGAGFWAGAHGGAIETAFDEATAELARFSPHGLQNADGGGELPLGRRVVHRRRRRPTSCSQGTLPRRAAAGENGACAAGHHHRAVRDAKKRGAAAHLMQAGRLDYRHRLRRTARPHGSDAEARRDAAGQLHSDAGGRGAPAPSLAAVTGWRRRWCRRGGAVTGGGAGSSSRLCASGTTRIYGGP